ncbi:interferon-regulated resistance hypothetical protein [Fusarium langsethiae]|uniref:Dynamin family protein n=1 Tax=Fusarium langsethiae TaxID=179993 RepID=A0A0M9ENX7_FUSLA|nr:interferon-regulated resistance hypothetical protein [Fusarium langsethiae]GKU07828.1 unnamed protein product [Fusarium langsethiae]
MDVSVDSAILKQLYTKEATCLHEISDGLSACGVGKIVNLPQIIVVGEQSVGKSSVLEAISHIKFPVDGGLCTRFATELILHHANETRIDASVRFEDKTKTAQAFQRKKFHEDDLPDIIKEAKEHMGISQNGNDFSKDVLRLEIEGPNIYPLSLVDLPGLYHTDTHNQLSNGKDTVEQLVDSYMRQKNSIILVVVAANVNMASHVALAKAKLIDPQRQRTIGVITKPDLALTANAKQHIIAAKNQESAHKLQLGWHVLRNRGEDEKSLETRDEVEKSFFETGPWATIPKEDLGINNFRIKLSGVLFKHIRNSLPGVIGDMETKLRERQEELTRLGTARSSLQEWRSYMLTIASDFQRLARDGCNGRYNDPFFGSLEDEGLKFRALLRNLNRVFDHILRTRGFTQSIVASDEEESEENGLPEYLARFLENYPYEFPEPEKITVEDLSIELETKAAANQGREFPGSPNADLAMQLFKNQAAPWKQIAEFHVDTVISIARAFVDQLFRHVVGSPQNNSTTEAILTIHVDPWFEGKEELLRKKIDELLWPYLTGYSLPVDIEFYRALSQKSTKRVANQICKTLEDQYPEFFNETSNSKFTPEKVTQAMALDHDSRMGEFGTDKIIDMMLTYYEMSRRTFTDNVINLAIESCLVHSLPDILTPTKVDNFTENQLQELAAERSETTSRRSLLNTEIDILREGLKTCRKYRPRAVKVLPSSKPFKASPAPTTASQTATKTTAISKPAATSSPSPMPAAANAKTTSELSSRPSTVATAGDKTNQVHSSATKDSAFGEGGERKSEAVVPKTQPQQSSTNSAPAAPAGLPAARNAVSSTAGGLIEQLLAQQQQKQPLAGTGTGLSGPPVFNTGGGGPSVTKNEPKQQLPELTARQVTDLRYGPPYMDLLWAGGTERFLHICHLQGYESFSPEELRYDESIRLWIGFGTTQPIQTVELYNTR